MPLLPIRIASSKPTTAIPYVPLRRPKPAQLGHTAGASNAKSDYRHAGRCRGDPHRDDRSPLRPPRSTLTGRASGWTWFKRRRHGASSSAVRNRVARREDWSIPWSLASLRVHRSLATRSHQEAAGSSPAAPSGSNVRRCLHHSGQYEPREFHPHRLDLLVPARRLVRTERLGGSLVARSIDVDLWLRI